MQRLLASLLILGAATIAGAADTHPALAKLFAARDIERLDPAQVPKITPPREIANGLKPLRVKVLVLEFNPLIDGRLYQPDDPSAQPKGLREVAGWNDPLPLSQGYMDDLLQASGGFIQYEVVEWLVVRRFQKKEDGYVYTPEAYMTALKQGTGKAEAWHKPDGIDYPAMIDEFNLIPLVEEGVIDEVWMMGLPYFGYYESAMAGKDAFYINGGVFDQVPCKRRFAIMGFNVERGTAEMTHDVCHRMESTMARVYGGWKVEELTTNWARFAANEKQSGTAAVGTCHYPPNAEHDYDYANPRTVESSADDWLAYPKLTGAKKRSINCEEWAGPFKNRKGDKPDYHRNYMLWWFSHLPKAPGVNDDGRLNNWWEYLYNFNAYDAQGRPLPDAKPPTDPAVEKQGARRPA